MPTIGCIHPQLSHTSPDLRPDEAADPEANDAPPTGVDGAPYAQSVGLVGCFLAVRPRVILMASSVID